MPTIKQHNSQSVPCSGLVREQLLVRTMRIEILQSLTATGRIEMHQSQTATVLLIMRHSSKQSKRHDPHPCDNIVRQTINELSFQTTVNNIFRNIKYIVMEKIILCSTNSCSCFFLPKGILLSLDIWCVGS